MVEYASSTNRIGIQKICKIENEVSYTDYNAAGDGRGQDGMNVQGTAWLAAMAKS